MKSRILKMIVASHNFLWCAKITFNNVFMAFEWYQWNF